MRGIIERCPTPTGAVLRRGRPSCGCAHKRLLGASTAEVVERLEAVRTGRPSVNTAVVWRYYTEKVYQNADLPLVAVRECLQNAVDAIDQAVKARQIRRGEGRFDVEWNEGASRLTLADNGIGMDMDTFFGKFMVIGESGKKGSDVSSTEGGRGGFGVAKAVILGTSATFRWKIHSRNHLYVSDGFDHDVQAFEAPFRQGTRIELFDVPQRFASFYDRRVSAYVALRERVRQMLAFNDLDMRMSVNEEVVPRYFDRRKGSKVALELDWGPGTTAEVKLYRRQDRAGRYFVRLNGLYQFDRAPSRSLPGDVVIDLDTDVRPDDPRRLPYPLTAARDGLTATAAAAAELLMGYLEVENVSAGDEREYDDLQALDPTPEEEAAADEVIAATRAAFEDEEILGALKNGVRGVEDYYREQTAEQARIGPRDPNDMSARPDGLAPAAVGQASPEPSGETGVAALVHQVLDVLSAAEHQRQRTGSASGSILSVEVKSALEQAARHGGLPGYDVLPVRSALEAAAGAAMGLHGGGILQLAGVEQAFQALKALAPVDPRSTSPIRNPFGTAGAVLISRKRYPRPRARRFLNNYKKWLPHLIVWDATLRMVASELKLNKPFMAGFVLDNDVVALARAANGRISVYINPDQFEVVRKASQGHPLTLAMFLLHTAVHELTHVDGRMGRGHDEEFIAAREDNGQKVAPLVVAVAHVAQQVLRLPESEDQKALRKLKDRVARLRDELQAARGQLRRTGRNTPPPATPAQKRERAEDLVDLLEGQLLGTPPEGIEPAYVVGFFQRNRAELVGLVRETLAELATRNDGTAHSRRPGASAEVVERSRRPGASAEVVERSRRPGASAEVVERSRRPGASAEVVERSRRPGASAEGRLPWDPHLAYGTVFFLNRTGAPRVKVVDPDTDYDGLSYTLLLPPLKEVPEGTVRTVRFYPDDDFASVVDGDAGAKGAAEVEAEAVIDAGSLARGSFRTFRILSGPYKGDTRLERDQDRAVPNNGPAAGDIVLVWLRPLDDVAEFRQVIPPSWSPGEIQGLIARQQEQSNGR